MKKLNLQKIAYQKEAILYDDWDIPPLTQTFPEIQAEFGNKVFLKATIFFEPVINFFLSINRTGFVMWRQCCQFPKSSKLTYKHRLLQQHQQY